MITSSSVITKKIPIPERSVAPMVDKAKSVIIVIGKIIREKTVVECYGFIIV
jgi:hypothetical protein